MTNENMRGKNSERDVPESPAFEVLLGGVIA